MCQNISTEVFLATSKNQAKVLSDGYVVGISFSREGDSFHPTSREEELKNNEHSMSMAVDTKASNFRNEQCLRVHVWFIVTIYYKMRQLFFLQNISGVLLQNTTVITKCINFISRWESYYKMRRILQNASVHKVYLVALREFPYCWDK